MKITYFTNNLPSLIITEIQERLFAVTSLLMTLRNRLSALLSGETKKKMCEWWLEHIEERVDGLAFLLFFFFPFSF